MTVRRFASRWNDPDFCFNVIIREFFKVIYFHYFRVFQFVKAKKDI